MRKHGSNGDRLDHHDSEIKKLKNEAKESQEKFEKHVEMHIKRDLQEPRYPGSDKYLYTYDDIANLHEVPKSKVQKIAEDNGLTRRKAKDVG